MDSACDVTTASGDFASRSGLLDLPAPDEMSVYGIGGGPIKARSFPFRRHGAGTSVLRLGGGPDVAHVASAVNVCPHKDVKFDMLVAWWAPPSGRPCHLFAALRSAVHTKHLARYAEATATQCGVMRCHVAHAESRPDGAQ